VHKAIDATGRHGAYVFDCLSELASLWSADQIAGQLFSAHLSSVARVRSVSYFGLTRNYHASFAIRPVTESAEFLLDVFQHQQQRYVRPIKVQHVRPPPGARSIAGPAMNSTP